MGSSQHAAALNKTNYGYRPAPTGLVATVLLECGKRVVNQRQQIRSLRVAAINAPALRDETAQNEQDVPATMGDDPNKSEKHMWPGRVR